jgi:predicted dehydrogenase
MSAWVCGLRLHRPKFCSAFKVRTMSQIAFVGCAHIHTPNFIKMCKGRADVTVRSVWDWDSARAKKRADELGAKVVGDVEQIWNDKEIEAVVICSETNRHEPLVLAAAKAGKHMFVEKPLGMGATDAYAMAEAIEKARVIFQTGYMSRGTPIHQFLREQVRQGNFGKITRYRQSNCHSGALGRWFDTEWRWMADPKQAGCGAFGDLGTHALDIMLWFMGEVENCTATVNPGTGTYGDCDETGEGLIKFKNGVIGSIAAAWDDVAHPVGLLISGTEGHAAVINGELFFQSKKVEGADGKTAWKDLPKGWPHAFELFLDAIGGNKEVSLVGAREAAYRSSVMEALYAGAREGKWVAPR